MNGALSPTEEEVRARAYELFVQRGCQHGYDQDDWLQAEYELRGLPVRKLAELEPAKMKPRKGDRKSLVNLVRAAMFVA